jgi:predicted metal-binding membrane protein
MADVEVSKPTAPSELSFTDAAPAWGALVILAVAAWFVTVAQARGMAIGPGTMGMDLPIFVGTWVVMMAAMMFPSVAPVAILWTRAIYRKEVGGARARRISEFVAGYLVAWTAFGLVAFAALLGTGWLAERTPDAARWLGVGIFALAGTYQLTPLKNVCLRHCRSPVAHLLHYGNVKGLARDLRVGLSHGLYCVGCCWGLMVVLIALGAMNVAAMAALAAVISLEKLWRRGVGFARVAGVALIVLAVLAAFHPSLLPGLHVSVDGMDGGMVGAMGGDVGKAVR